MGTGMGSIAGAVASFAAMAMQAPPAGWEMLLSDETGQIHFDPASIRDEGQGRRSASYRIHLSAPAGSAAVRYDNRMLFDCGARTSAYLAARAYDRSGNVTGSRETAVADAQASPVEADSVEALLLDRACR